MLGAPQEQAEGVGGNPPRNLLDLANTGDGLEYASSEVADQRLGIGEICRHRSGLAEIRFLSGALELSDLVAEHACGGCACECWLVYREGWSGGGTGLR